MIAFHPQDQSFSPGIYCDCCDGPITDAHMALALIPPASRSNNGDPVPILHAHKGACTDFLEIDYDFDLLSEELSTHLIEVARSCVPPAGAHALSTN